MKSCLNNRFSRLHSTIHSNYKSSIFEHIIGITGILVSLVIKHTKGALEFQAFAKLLIQCTYFRV